MTRFTLFFFLCALALPPALAGDKKPPVDKQPPNDKQALEGKKGFKGGKGKGKSEPGEPRKYEDVITKEAKTQEGVFKVHHIGDKLYFEIPKAALGKLMLWTAEIARAP